jgi:hypothetical protein
LEFEDPNNNPNNLDLLLSRLITCEGIAIISNIRLTLTNVKELEVIKNKVDSIIKKLKLLTQDIIEVRQNI